MSATIFGFFHLCAALVLGTAIAIQVLALGPRTPREDLPAIRRLGSIMLAALLVTALSGFVLWLWIGRPADFYSANLLFRIKLGLFALLIVVTVWPALFIRRALASSSEEASAVMVPATVRWSLNIALLTVLCMPALAYMMARGIG